MLRTLVETELSARDASNIVNRLKAAGFPVAKTLESFDVASSSIQPKVFDYLSSLMGSCTTESGDHRTRRDRQVPLCRGADYADVAVGGLVTQGNKAIEVGITRSL